MAPSLALLRPASFLSEAAPVSLFETDRRADLLLPTDPTPGADGRPQRRRLWELAESLHCSIVGTCLSNADLRRVFVKLGSAGAETADEHDLHVRGVSAAARRETGAKLLQKALDRRHAVAIRRYAAARNEAALTALWDESLRQGDVPGGYWALLTHPNTTRATAKKAFQDVHMLSHLVGAANRADIRRLRQIEKENEALTDKLCRQEKHLREGFRYRDHTIQLLRDMLAHRSVGTTPTGPAAQDGDRPLPEMVADLNKRLGQEEARRQRLQQRVGVLSAALQATRTELRNAQRERDMLARDLDTLEAEVARLTAPARADAGPCLTGDTLLYVGGRTRHIPQIKAWVERAGGRLLHHDGGVEHNPALLPGLIGRADVSCFPIDCVSHDAVAIIKKSCRQMRKPYLPLRTCGIAALMSALSDAAGGHASAAE